ncbi:restriction endonuclease [Tsukamurella soli]|uniref:Type III restriction enzyme C-terminal endonuclease domain-containing protein n=1 Tax=Tsukamurella soli TaxID=644556 RepID=A0ABP8KEL8_9ACTN
MQIIDNLNELLGDDLKASITPGSKLRIAASTFSIFAFEALNRELQSIKELDFIFTAPSFTTPVGDCNPDWAIAFRDDTTKIKHVYFVAETKGSMSTLQLKGVENAKIECARKFFASLNDRAANNGVKYDVVDSYDSLLQLVGA